MKRSRTITTSGAAKQILLGHVSGAHGIRGEVLIKTYTAAPEDIDAYGPLRDEKGIRSFVLKVVRVTPKGGVIARVKGLDDRDAADALKGTGLYVARDKLPPSDAAEFYHADLVGLMAVDSAGKQIGIVMSVQNYGAGDLLELAREGVAKTEFVPFTLAVVPQIDIAGGRLVVVLPEAASQDSDRPDGES